MFRRCVAVAFSFLLVVLGAASPAMAGPYEDGEAAFQRKDYTAAMRHWQRLAEAGDARAQSRVAALYYGGLGVALNYETAAMWCEKSADQGDANAQYLLGAMYRDGKGVERDSQKAFALSLKAADQGVPGAQYNLGLMHMMGEGVPANYVEAYYWLGVAALASGKEYSRLRSTAAFAQDEAGLKLSPDQIAEAKRRIDERKIAQSR